MQQKKTAKDNNNHSKQPLKQVIKHTRGAKPGATITRVIKHREIIEKAYLKLYIGNWLDVKPENGLTTLAKFLYGKQEFTNKSNKPIAINTIRQELTEISKELKYINPRGKKSNK